VRDSLERSLRHNCNLQKCCAACVKRGRQCLASYGIAVEMVNEYEVQERAEVASNDEWWMARVQI
jgi:hypothetical protein